MEKWIQSNIYFDRNDPTNAWVSFETNVEDNFELSVLTLYFAVALAFRHLIVIGPGKHSAELCGWLVALGMAMTSTDNTDAEFARRARGAVYRFLNEVNLKREAYVPSAKRFEARLRSIEMDNDPGSVDSKVKYLFDSSPKGFPLFGMFGNTPYHAALAVKALLKYVWERHGDFVFAERGVILLKCAGAYLDGQLNNDNELSLAIDTVNRTFESFSDRLQ